MRRYVFYVFLAVVMIGSQAAQAADEPRPMPPQGSLFQGTAEERAACAPDATKFCQDAIPDTFRVLGCLQNNREKISQACQKVLADHGQ